MANRGRPAWEPKAVDYQTVFASHNPWHSTGQVPPELAFESERAVGQLLWSRLVRDTPRRFQVLLGPRRVGKTVALFQTARHLISQGVPRNLVWYLRLDHPLLMRVPINSLVQLAIDLSHATPENPVYLLLDELVYAKDWRLWLKTFYDERWPVRIAATSSSTAALQDGRQESGIGRWEEQYLWPYLFGEYLDLVHQEPPVEAKESLEQTIEALIAAAPVVDQAVERRMHFLLVGGFPELLLSSNGLTDDPGLLLRSQQILRSDAIERVIYKDIPQAARVSDPLLLERLLYVLAGQFTGIMSPQNICQSLDGLSASTFDRYLSHLERSFLIFTTPSYAPSEESIARRGRKVYFVDGAIRNAALQRGAAPLTDPKEVGHLIENLAASHLHAYSRLAQQRLFFWRDRTHEVDLVLDHAVEPLAFEISSSASHSHGGLHALQEQHPRFRNRCYVVSPGSVIRPPGLSTGEIGYLPLELFLVAISAQVAREYHDRLFRKPQDSTESLFTPSAGQP